MAVSRRLDLVWIDASHLEPETLSSSPAEYHKAWHQLCTAQGILVPGGFGHRGTEGMIAAASWARVNAIPYLGICLGMQIAVIEFAKNVCNMPNATSEEFEATNSNEHVIIFMPEGSRENKGGVSFLPDGRPDGCLTGHQTMRLGARATHWQPGSEGCKLRALYDRGPQLPLSPNGISDGPASEPLPTAKADAAIIVERHRHRHVSLVPLDRPHVRCLRPDEDTGMKSTL
jgi:CTP synthase